VIPISGAPCRRNVAAYDLAVPDQQNMQYRAVLLFQSRPGKATLQTPYRDAAPSRVSGDPSRYFAAAVLRSAAAQASATSRLGSACPGNVAHPVFITNSVCS